MKVFALFALLCLLGLGVRADSIVGPGCGVSVTTTARSGGSFQSGSGMSQIYDIVVTNTGKCNADNIALNIDSAGRITSSWNLEASSRYYLVTGYESTLPVGNSVNTGVVVQYDNTNSIPDNGVSTTVYGTTCPSECVNAQATSTSASSATVATTATTSSIPPASTTATSGSSPSGNCAATATVTARSGGSYQSGSGMSQIYDIVVRNSGSCPLTDIAITAALPSGATITQTWNLQQSSGLTYTVTGYEGRLPAGNSVNVGMVVLYPNTQTVPDNGLTAAISTSTCPADCPTGGSGSGSGSGSASGSDSGSATSTSTTGSATGSSGSCAITVTTTARSGGSYQSGSGISQIYDIVVRNSGSCQITDAELNIDLPAGSSIQSSWNLQVNAGHYKLTSYEAALPVGNSVNAGVVVNFPGTQAVPAGVAASTFSTACNSVCNA